MSLNLKERYGLLINNEWVAASDGAEFNVYNPANGEQLAICAEATNDDVDKAVEAATEAFKIWKKVSQVERADYLLNEVGAAHLRNMYPSQLSGGEQRRVAIARALINSPKILIADEPTSDLDVASIRTIMNLLERIHSKGMTLLVVTHELDAVSLDQRICVMQDGCLQEITCPTLKKEDLVSCLSI